jgi:hypothetical protein
VERHDSEKSREGMRAHLYQVLEDSQTPAKPAPRKPQVARNLQKR